MCGVRGYSFLDAEDLRNLLQVLVILRIADNRQDVAARALLLVFAQYRQRNIEYKGAVHLAHRNIVAMAFHTQELLQTASVIWTSSIELNYLKAFVRLEAE